MRATRAQSGVVVGLLVCGLGAALLRLEPQELGMACAAGMLVGFIGGKMRRSDHCSDPACNGNIRPADVRCPKCERRIAGTIENAADRLDAEHKLRKGKP